MQWAWIIPKPSLSPNPWKNCIPRNKSLVPKMLGTTALGHSLTRWWGLHEGLLTWNFLFQKGDPGEHHEDRPWHEQQHQHQASPGPMVASVLHGRKERPFPPGLGCQHCPYFLAGNKFPNIFLFLPLTFNLECISRETLLCLLLIHTHWAHQNQNYLVITAGFTGCPLGSVKICSSETGSYNRRIEAGCKSQNLNLSAYWSGISSPLPISQHGCCAYRVQRTQRWILKEVLN